MTPLWRLCPPRTEGERRGEPELGYYPTGGPESRTTVMCSLHARRALRFSPLPVPWTCCEQLHFLASSGEALRRKLLQVYAWGTAHKTVQYCAELSTVQSTVKSCFPSRLRGPLGLPCAGTTCRCTQGAQRATSLGSPGRPRLVSSGGIWPFLQAVLLLSESQYCT